VTIVRESGQAGEEGPATADDVAEATSRDDERRDRQQVGVGDPLQLARRGAELAVQFRQRQVDDRRVEHQHREPAAGPGEHPPSAICGVGCHRAKPYALPIPSSDGASRDRTGDLLLAGSFETVTVGLPFVTS